MKQRIVMKVEMMKDEKAKTEAKKVAAVAKGVLSVAIEGPLKDHLVVVGDDVDSAILIKTLRKKVGHANIVSVKVVHPNPNGNNKKCICEFVSSTCDYCRSINSGYAYATASPTYQYYEPPRPSYALPTYQWRVVDDSYHPETCSTV